MLCDPVCPQLQHHLQRFTAELCPAKGLRGWQDLAAGHRVMPQSGMLGKAGKVPSPCPQATHACVDSSASSRLLGPTASATDYCLLKLSQDGLNSSNDKDLVWGELSSHSRVRGTPAGDSYSPQRGPVPSPCSAMPPARPWHRGKRFMVLITKKCLELRGGMEQPSSHCSAHQG